MLKCYFMLDANVHLHTCTHSHTHHTWCTHTHMHTYTHAHRDFRLYLSPNRKIFHSHFKAVTVDSNNTEAPINVDLNEFYHGRVYGMGLGTVWMSHVSKYCTIEMIKTHYHTLTWPNMTSTPYILTHELHTWLSHDPHTLHPPHDPHMTPTPYTLHTILTWPPHLTPSSHDPHTLHLPHDPHMTPTPYTLLTWPPHLTPSTRSSHDPHIMQERTAPWWRLISLDQVFWRPS